jgi:Protein of unknown function (DUF3999)
MKRIALVVIAGLALAAPAWAQDEQDFRFVRTLEAPGRAAIVIEPDPRMYAHSQPDFADLRILDRAGRQVPWRSLPEPTLRSATVPVLNSGREGGFATALLDFGPRRQVRDRIELSIPDSGFVGRVQVLGSHDRRRYTRLSTSVVYDVQGVEGRARSTVIAFPPSDFRYLQLRARGVSRIDGAVVSRTLQTPRPIRRDAVTTQVSSDPTRIVLDLGHANVPVDELEVSSSTRRYDRPARVEGSNDRKLWVPLATARVFRLGGSAPTSIRVDGRHRYLRLTIVNGDDPPLEQIRVAAFARPRPLLVEGGHARPLRMLYGDSRSGSPSYDFARLPPPKRMERGTLGREQRNAAFEPPPDTRSFAARHSGVVTAALVLAALAAAAAGGLALRRRA